MAVTYAERLAEAITKARTDAGMTRAELYRQTGISPKSLKRYEDGLQVPHKSTLRIIEKALKVSMNELMTGKAEAEVKPQEPVDPFALKPCPFCGGEAMLLVNNGVIVICERCRARSPGYSDDISLKTNAVKSVIEAWNRRTNEQEN